MQKKILLALMIIVISTIVFFTVSASAETEGIYTYSVIDGEATITDCDISTSGEIVIPNRLGGWPVTKIGEEAFRNCTNLTSVTIGDNITEIHAKAFHSCKSITSITIPDSVTVIGSAAFLGCESLTSVNITDMTAWCNIEFIDYSANPLRYAEKLYLNSKLVTDLIIPDGTTIIGGRAFSYYEGLVSITIPDSVTIIGYEAFYGCKSLTSVNITDIAAWCNIKFASVSANPLDFAGKLYLNGELVTNLTIPDGVTKISQLSFRGCESLERVTIPDSVTEIDNYAFSFCTGLTNVTIPDSITTIDVSAFYGCSSLTDVYYNGTEEAWDAISIASNNEPLTNATIHFISNIQEEYCINSITLKDMQGNSLQAIPAGTFLATVSFTNISASADTLIILGQYTSAGAFKGLMYIQTEDVPTGSTIKLSIPVDNTSGDVAKLKAFSWASFGSMTPLGNTVSFPAEQ